MDNLNDYSELRSPEFQVVIIMDHDDGRMFPLTEGCPRGLLPIGNRKLLSYQLDMIEHSGGLEVYIVAPREYEIPVSQFMADYVRGQMSVEFVPVDEMMGSVDGLKAVSDRIRGDFICISSDVISQYSLADLVKLHRVQTSDITMMFATVSKDVKRDEVDEEIVGITDEGRVVIKTQKLEVADEDIEIGKPLMHRAPNLSLKGNLLDLGIYVMSHWVIEFLKTNNSMSSIRTDLIPYFIKRQFQPASYLLDKIPALQHRCRPLNDLESWLVSSDHSGVSASALLHHVTSNIRAREEANEESAGKAARGSSMATVLSAASVVAAPAVVTSEDTLNLDLLRCYGVVYDVRAAAAVPNSGAIILNKVSNIATYMNLNKEIANHSFGPHSPWKRFTTYLKKETSIVGEKTDLAGKNVTFKQCCIGNNCTIGAQTKLNNCVIMDNVTIGDECTIQNCVISEKVVIEGKCNLNECHIGQGFKVTAGTKAKGETYALN